MEFGGNYLQRGLALDQAGRTDEAIAEWRKGLSLNPGDMNLHFSLAYALRDKGKHLEALTHFREAARLRPDYYNAWFMLGKALVKHLKQRPSVLTR